MKMRMTVLAVLMAVTPQTRATINRALRPDDFEVVWAADGSEAVEASARRRPDLVLMDVSRRLEGAWGSLERLRAANPGAPVVVLAERGATCNRGIADTKVAVIEKPFGSAALVEAVNALLNLPLGTATPSHRRQEVDVGEAAKCRESLLARRDAPLALVPSYRHFGINE